MNNLQQMWYLVSTMRFFLKGLTPECLYSGFQFRIRLDFRRRTDPSKALWRTRLKHAGMTGCGRLFTDREWGNSIRVD